MNCYSVWDGFDEFESKYTKGKDINFTYNIFLQRVIETYFYILKSCICTIIMHYL